MMQTDPRHFGYESMGTKWMITVWDECSDEVFDGLSKTIIEQSQEFDRTYSRFKKTSLIWELSQKQGVVPVPKDLIDMLRLYERLFDCSRGQCNPLVGFAISDLGYDAEYSLQTQKKIRPVPNLHDAITILDDGHIELFDSVLIDLGAVGKGFFVDKIAAFLQEKGMQRFLVDGSGDIYYKGNGQTIRAGLEHPGDPTKAIGVVEMTDGAMCGSGSNRRKWGSYHHIIDPTSLQSPQQVVASWVMADNAALADGLATCLFLTEPECFENEFSFEYCLMNREHKIKRSAGFTAELF